jgi:hypothetical protein
MRQIYSPSQRAAGALRRAERALRDWQDDPDAPRADVDRMLSIMSDLRVWVQGHVLADIERAENQLRSHQPPGPGSSPGAPRPEAHRPDSR